MRMLKMLCLVVGVSSIAISCAKDEKKKKNKNTSEEGENGNGDGDSPDRNDLALEDAIIGSWQGDCETRENGGSLVATYEFKEGKGLNMKFESFADTECSKSNFLVSYDGEYHMADEESEDVEGGRLIRTDLQRGTATLNSDDFVIGFNLDKTCGQDWKKAEATSIPANDADCPFSEVIRDDELGSIFRVEGSKLYDHNPKDADDFDIYTKK